MGSRGDSSENENKEQANLQSRLEKLTVEVAKLNHELLGAGTLKPENAESGTELMEMTTIRQLLEKVVYDLDVMKQDVQELKQERVNKTWKGAGADEAVTAYEPAEIVPNTREDEEKLVSKELNELADRIPLMALAGGQSADELSNDSGTCSFVIEIRNYLDVSLSNAQIMQYSTCAALPSFSIPGLTHQLLVMKPPSTGSDLVDGMISFNMGREIKFFVRFYAGSAGTRLGLSIVPFTSTINEYGMISGHSNLTRSSFRSQGQTDIKELVAHAGDLAAKGTLIKEGTQSIAVVEIGRIKNRDFSKRKQACLQMLLRPSRLTSAVSIEEILSLVPLNFACVVVFGNALKTNLDDPQLHFSKDENYTKWPKSVESMSSDNMFFFCASAIEGLISYRIPNTELRVTLAFRVQETGNLFVVGFTPVHTVIDQALLNEFFQLDPLNTAYNRKWGNARDGEQVATKWNVMAIAKMFPDPKAVLEVVVCTY